MKKKIKVLHVIGGGEFGGAEQYLITLLRNMDRQDFHIVVACLFGAPLAGRLAAEGFPHRVFPMAGKLDLKVIFRLSDYIKENCFDIVHTHGVRANLVGRLAARKAGIKNIVTTIHSNLEYDYPRKLDLYVNKISEKLTLPLTKHFITVSEDLAGYVCEKYGISKRRVSVIYNGLELNKYFFSEAKRAQIRKQFKIADNETLLAVISRLHPVKGHSILFYAFEQLVRDFPFLKLLIVGTGPEKKRLEEQARELGIAGNVIFAGFRKDIPEVLTAVDIVVQPSLSEGFGLSIIEAMAMEKPVVASAVGGVPEIIKNRVNGLLVPPGDPIALSEAITSVLELPGLARELARTGRETVEKKFTAEAMARKTAEVYEKLVRRRARKMQRGKKA